MLDINTKIAIALIDLFIWPISSVVLIGLKYLVIAL
jgi:hypothetical protein